MKRFPLKAPYRRFDRKYIRRRLTLSKRGTSHWPVFWRTVLSAAVGGIAAVIVVIVQQKIAAQDRNVQFLEYANKLLTLPVNDKPEIRRFAVDIIDNSSPVGHLSAAARKEFMSLQMPVSVTSASGQRPMSVERLYARPSDASRKNYDPSPKMSGITSNASIENRISTAGELGIVSIPSDVQVMYVFLQRRTVKDGNGCREFRIEPEMFANRIGEFIRIAKDDKDLDIVITAKSPTKGWGAVQDISIQGVILEHDFDYYCDNWKRSGSKLVI